MSLRRHRTNEHRASFTVRPASVSRRAINITVDQQRDELGNWLLPTIIISESIPQSTEDIVFMRSIAEALLLACLEAIEMMDYIE